MLERRIDVAGLMPSEMEQRIADALVAEQIVKAPAVTVTIAEYYSRPISVVGAARQPLTFPAYGKTTLLEALARAQGLNAEAGNRDSRHSSATRSRRGGHGRTGIGEGANRRRGPGAQPDAQTGAKRCGCRRWAASWAGNVRKPGGFPPRTARR